MSPSAKKVPPAWIDKLKALFDIVRGVDIQNRYNLAKHIKDGLDKYNKGEIYKICGHYGITSSMIRSLLAILKAWPDGMPDDIFEDPFITWSHVTATVNDPNVIFKAMKNKWTVGQTKEYVNGYATVKKKKGPKQVDMLARNLIKHLKGLSMCPAYLRKTLKDLDQASDKAKKLPAA